MNAARLLALGALGGISACGLFVGYEPLRFLQGDAGPDAPNGNDATDATGAPDASDAGEDATPPPSYCVTSAPDAAFCADFEESLVAAHGPGGSVSQWVPSPQTGPGVVSRAGGAGHLSAASMHVTVPSSGGPFLESMQFVSKLLPSSNRVRISFWVRLDDCSDYDADAALHPVQLGGLEMGVAATPYKLHVALYPPNLLAGSRVVLTEVRHPDGGVLAYREIAQSGTLKPAVWTRIQLVVDLPLGTVNIAMSTDTQAAADAGTYTLELDPITQPTLALGLLSDGFASWTAHFDDYEAETIP